MNSSFSYLHGNTFQYNRVKYDCILTPFLHIVKVYNPVLCLYLVNVPVLSTPTSNWTSWLDYYGFGKCTDLKHCDVFPDGKPFPQSNDRGYVYVWHTMGMHTQAIFVYFITCNTIPCFIYLLLDMFVS